MTYVKSIMAIGSGDNSIAIQDVWGISGEFDLDNICGILSFQLPYFIPLPDSKTQQYALPNSGVTTNRLKKFDTVKLYFKEYETDPGNISQKSDDVFIAGGQQLIKIFDGFIDTIKLRSSKTVISYEITALGTLGLSNYRSLEYEHKTGTAYELFQTFLQIAGLQKGQFNVFPVDRDIIPANMVRFFDVDATNRVIISDGGTELKAVLDGLKRKYALLIFQSGDGYVNVMTPFSLLSAQSNSTLNVNVWAFNVNIGTLFEIDYGDLTQDYNAIVILGQPSIYGVAVDTIAVQNNGGHVNYLIFENRSLASDEDCQKVARDKLLDMEKNYVVTVKTKFAPEFMCGQPFTIIDNDRYDGTQVLLMKKYTFTIDKNDVSCTVQGFAHGATLIPEDIALSNTGVLDVDILQIRDKELDTTLWKTL